MSFKEDLLDVLSDPNVEYPIDLKEDLKSMAERILGVVKEPGAISSNIDDISDFINNLSGFTGCCLGDKDDPKSTKAMFITFFHKPTFVSWI